MNVITFMVILVLLVQQPYISIYHVTKSRLINYVTSTISLSLNTNLCDLGYYGNTLYLNKWTEDRLNSCPRSEIELIGDFSHCH